MTCYRSTTKPEILCADKVFATLPKAATTINFLPTQNTGNILTQYTGNILTQYNILIDTGNMDKPKKNSAIIVSPFV